MNQQITVNQTNTGKIGFMLTLAAPLSVIMPFLILALIPLSIFAWFLFLIPPVLFILSIIYCIHGLIRKRNRKLATTGLLINAIIVIFLFFLLITLTPPGSIPYPLNIYKFKRACPKAVFWLDFDRNNIELVQSQRLFIFGHVSTVHFASPSNTYTNQQIIQYAETTGWKYHLSIPASKFLYILEADENDLSLKELEFKVNLTAMNPISMAIEKGDKLLVFETGNYLGCPSFIVIPQNRNNLKVYYNNPSRPDPRRDFWLPEMFYELSEKKE